MYSSDKPEALTQTDYPQYISQYQAEEALSGMCSMHLPQSIKCCSACVTQRILVRIHKRYDFLWCQLERDQFLPFKKKNIPGIEVCIRIRVSLHVSDIDHHDRIDRDLSLLHPSHPIAEISAKGTTHELRYNDK
jgi:hypothetical protein